jgi:Tol biopolymer transport system component
MHFALIARYVSIALATTAWLFAWASDANASFPGENGKLAYVTNTGTCTGYPDGTGLQCFSLGGEYDVAWSPNGTKLALGADPEIFTVNPDGSGAMQLTGFQGGSTFAPAWSPDQTKIIFTRQEEPIPGCEPGDPGCDPTSDIWVMNADGSGLGVLFDSQFDDYAGVGSYSPDGKKIAFETSIGGQDFIYVMNADGTGATALNQKGGPPNWSPDGSWLAFASSRDGSTDIYKMRPDGTGVTQLTNDDISVVNLSPAWSPDGTKIVFRSIRVPNRIDVMNADGTGRSTAFTASSGNSFFSVDWQPIVRGYPRPKGATPFKTYLVPAYHQCTNPNSFHGAPLSYPSCGARAESQFVTMGTPDANGAAAKSIDSLLLRVRGDNPATSVDEADVVINLSATDMRCTGTTAPAACGSNNSAPLSDYIGELEAHLVLRITDRNNTPNPGGPGPGTVRDSPFTFTVSCTGTSGDVSIGSTCVTATSANALVPGIVAGGRRSNWELGPVQVYNGGSDGVVSTTVDNELFLNQGVFVP